MKQSSIHGKGLGIITVLFCFCWLSVLTASAATYYVDYSAGSDTNNGTAATAAWQHCPGDTNASGVPLASVFQPGDKVIFKGGVYYVGAVVLPWSGSSNNPITYDGNSAGTFGTGRALVGGNYSSNQVYGFETPNCPFGYNQPGTSNLVFNDLEIAYIGGHSNISWTATNLPASPITYAMFFCNCQGINISNCYFHDIGDWTNAPNMSINIMKGGGVTIQGGCTNVTLSGCEFTHIGKAAISLIVMNGEITNVTITNCLIHDYVTWAVQLTPEENGGALHGVTIDGLVQSNCYQYSPNLWQGVSGYWPHTDGIFCFLGNSPYAANCTLGSPSAPIIIRRCTFVNNDTNSYYDIAGTANIYVSDFGGSVWIYDNTFVNVLNRGEGAIDLYQGIPGANGGTPIDFRIYNNSFYMSNTLGVYIAGITNVQTNGAITVENNIFYNTASSGGGIPIFADATSFPKLGSSFTLDYNEYVQQSGYFAATAQFAGTFYTSLAALQAIGFESHGQFADPRWANLSYGLGGQSSYNDLHLTAISPGIAAGANLGAIFARDKDGNPRPASGAWDLGAYQFAAALPAPPGFHIVQ